MKDISYWFLCLLLLFLDLHYLVWFFSENIKGNSRKTYLGNNYKGNSTVSLLSVTFLSLSLFFFFFWLPIFSLRRFIFQDFYALVCGFKSCLTKINHFLLYFYLKLIWNNFICGSLIRKFLYLFFPGNPARHHFYINFPGQKVNLNAIVKLIWGHAWCKNSQGNKIFFDFSPRA